MRVRFGDFRLDTDTRQLFRHREAVHLTPKALDLLTVLVVNRPNAVSKADLHERLWPSTFVTDANLAILVGEIRSVLRDSARRPRFIRTVQRFGYAFAADATAVGTRRGSSSGAVCWLMATTQKFALDEGEHVIGRTPESDVSIDSDGVSRRHARIVVKANTRPSRIWAARTGRGSAASASPRRTHSPTRIASGLVRPL